MLAEELWCLLQDPWHLLSCCIDQDHLCDVDNICLVGLLCQVALINVECLQIDAAYELAVRFSKFLYQAENLFGIAITTLVHKLLQIIEQFVENLREQGSLADCSFTKEEVNFFT